MIAFRSTFDNRVSSLAVVLLGLTSSVPLYFHLPGGGVGAPIFYVQCIVILALLCLYSLQHRKVSLSSLDQFVVLYLVWLMVSFIVNIPAMWITGRSDLVRHQLTSMLAWLFTVSPYLLGRCYFDIRRHGPTFIRSAAIGLAIVIAGYILFYSRNFTDLYLARHTIGQRIPMMICFLAWAICAQGFWHSRQRVLLLLLWFGSMLIVLLSLTRAAYFQWFVSAALFAVISLFRNYKTRAKLIWRFGVVGIIGLACVVGIAVRSLSAPSLDSPATQVIGRVGQLFALREQVSTDESANSRVEVWRRLFARLKESPARMIFGFGQLAPSAYIGGTFIDLSGEILNEYNAHSEYMDAWIRSGLVGLLLECAVLGIVTAKTFFVEAESTYLVFFKTHSVALIGIIIYGVFHETWRFQMFGLYFWLYAGIVSRELFSRETSLIARNFAPHYVSGFGGLDGSRTAQG